MRSQVVVVANDGVENPSSFFPRDEVMFPEQSFNCLNHSFCFSVCLWTVWPCELLWNGVVCAQMLKRSLKLFTVVRIDALNGERKHSQRFIKHNRCAVTRLVG